MTMLANEDDKTEREKCPHNCQLLEAGPKRWIGIRARRFHLVDGSIKYQPLVEFSAKRALQNVALSYQLQKQK